MCARARARVCVCVCVCVCVVQHKSPDWVRCLGIIDQEPGRKSAYRIHTHYTYVPTCTVHPYRIFSSLLM